VIALHHLLGDPARQNADQERSEKTDAAHHFVSVACCVRINVRALRWFHGGLQRPGWTREMRERLMTKF
jgi:hypothetical protein